MKLIKRKVVTLFFLFSIFLVLISQISTSFASQSAQNHFIDFLDGVVMLDMDKYSVHVASDIVDYPSELNGLERNGIVITLESSESTLHAYAYVIDGHLFSCSITAETGEPEYSQLLPTDFVELAKGFLERYEAFTGDSSISSMSDMLNSKQELSIGDTISGNIKMSISDLFNPIFSWTITYDDVDYTQLQFSYQSYQQFFSFLDDRIYHEIGQTDVNVSRDEAISIAQNQIDDFSWIIIEDDGEQVEVENFIISTVDATLSAETKGNTMTLQPIWNVNFILDKVYPGNVQTLIVTIWAGNSEVNYIYPLTTSNWFVNDGLPIPTLQSIPLEAIILSLVIIPIAIVLVIFIKRKR